LYVYPNFFNVNIKTANKKFLEKWWEEFCVSIY